MDNENQESVVDENHGHDRKRVVIQEISNLIGKDDGQIKNEPCYSAYGNESRTNTEDGFQTAWSDLTTKDKVLQILKIGSKVTCAFILLYFFICSLDILSVGFRIIGGRHPQNILKADILNNNSVAGLMCGVLFTVIVQSSSTTTSTVVGLVAVKFIPIRSAIPIIMGANIGTSVTNTLLAMVQVSDRDQFRRAFAAATCHDMFNWLATLVLLPVESTTGYLYYTTHFVVQKITFGRSNGTKNIKLLKALTEPLTKKIVQLDRKVTAQWNSFGNESMDYKSAVKKTGHLFAGSGWSDNAIGVTVVIIAFTALLVCLFLMVKMLKSILHGRIANWIRKTSNAQLPYCPKMTDYVLMLMGAIMTFLIQSSSAFTSTIPPLVAVKALSLERAYALTIGSNIGTTTTALLASLAQSESRLFADGLQIALCHLLFNVTGLLLFYPIPCTRYPIRMSKFLGNITSHYRWFAILYVIVLFMFLPLLFMGLAFAGTPYVITVATFLIIGFLAIATINTLREYPRFLPKCLHTWNFLPEWIRSLEPYDRLFTKCACCHRLVKPAKIQGQEGAGGAPRNDSVKEREVDEGNT